MKPSRVILHADPVHQRQGFLHGADGKQDQSIEGVRLASPEVYTDWDRERRTADSIALLIVGALGFAVLGVVGFCARTIYRVVSN